MIKTKRTIELEEENIRLNNKIDSLNRKLEWYEQECKKKEELFNNALHRANNLEYKIEDYLKEIEDLKNTINEKDEELDNWKRCNRNLLRINKEKSNAKRGIYPKKEHSGYLLIYSNPIDYKYYLHGTHKKAQLYQTAFQTPYTIDVSYEDVYDSVIDDLAKKRNDEPCLLKQLGCYYFWPYDIYEVIIEDNIKEAQDDYYNQLIEDFTEKNNRKPYYSEEEEMRKESWDYDTDYFFNMNLRLNGKEGYWEVVLWHNFPINEVPPIMRYKKEKKDDKKDKKV